jgi:hypothetical protein
VSTHNDKRNQATLVAFLGASVLVTWVVVTARWSPWSGTGSRRTSPATTSSALQLPAPCPGGWCEVERVTPELAAKVSGTHRSLRLRNATNETLGTVRLAAAVVDLTIASSREPLDLAPLADLHELRALTIEQSSVASLEPLASTSIEKLTLGFAKAVDTLAPLVRMKHIQELEVTGPLLPTLASLSGAHLRRLSVQSSNLSTLDGIDGVSGLEDLAIRACPVTDLSPLARLSGVVQLEIGWSVLSVPPALPPHVTTLALFSDHLTDVSFLRDRRELTTLSLLGNDVRDVSPIASLVNLTALNLDDNPNLKDISPLRSLRKLETIGLGGTAIQSLDALGDMRLTSVELAGTKVTSLAPLARIPTLQSVELLPKKFPQDEVDALRSTHPKIMVSRTAK